MSLIISIVVCVYLLAGAWTAKFAIDVLREDGSVDKHDPFVLVLAAVVLVIVWPIVPIGALFDTIKSIFSKKE